MANPTPALHFSTLGPLTPRNVAIIGAGAAGLVVARELRQEGHKVVVFEKEDKVGGTWAYNPSTESDPLGLDPSRTVVHSSLYESLRTNLPREVMGFRVYPFSAKKEARRDPRRFPGHAEVLEYLIDFASEFGLSELVRLGTEVKHVGLVESGKWKVRSEKGGDQLDEIYDAVVVCSGHYTEPRIAEIPGIDRWPGQQIHSHNYRVPDPFQGQVVVLIGGSASATDISREVAEVAQEVHVASRSFTGGSTRKLPGYGDIWLHSTIETAYEDGTVVFQDGSAIRADIILHCTGYKYHFPFLDTNGNVIVDENRVGPLYKHVFPPLLAPWLSFVGLPWKVAPFPLFEFQSKWIAGVLSGQVALPSSDDMMADVESFYKTLEASGIPKRYTHNLEHYQFEYIDWLAAECGCPPSEDWRKSMFAACRQNRASRPETYRDEWDDQELVLQAYEDFVKCGLKGGVNGIIPQ